jgi:C1A family cysteine protease
MNTFWPEYYRQWENFNLNKNFMKRVYGWKKQPHDKRDFKCTLSVANLPALVDLRPKMPPVYDQGQIGSCTANAIGGAIEYEHVKQFNTDLMPSRLFIYYNERAIEGTVKEDSGANIRDGIKSVNTQGVCPENLWPYNIKKFKTKPSKTCYSLALKDKALKYAVVSQDLNSMKSVLASGFPIVGGFTVYESFESAEVAKTGMVPTPGKDEQILGGHAVMIVGYDDSKGCFIVRNSWSNTWGLSGYCYMPYAYWTNPDLASDFWNIDLLSA